MKAVYKAPGTPCRAGIPGWTARLPGRDAAIRLTSIDVDVNIDTLVWVVHF
ncbi:hypothetical protein [Burkholderia plantarii]|uniref:hypothetical protein n=1 Tax=Burkholderia plantarii TaxID=41899 RepID=UPI0018DCFFDA|nr:hypothetical protein [Burkholderia plantarii]MBI0330079.1 hypothetical protein [Burkholderia plantarii]